ncbi:hypothetical protein [Thermococcus sp.]
MASLLLLKPRYVILDEPDSGLDITAGELIEELLGGSKRWERR